MAHFSLSLKVWRDASGIWRHRQVWKAALTFTDLKLWSTACLAGENWKALQRLQTISNPWTVPVLTLPGIFVSCWTVCTLGWSIVCFCQSCSLGWRGKRGARWTNWEVFKAILWYGKRIGCLIRGVNNPKQEQSLNSNNDKHRLTGSFGPNLGGRRLRVRQREGLGRVMREKLEAARLKCFHGAVITQGASGWPGSKWLHMAFSRHTAFFLFYRLHISVSLLPCITIRLTLLLFLLCILDNAPSFSPVTFIMLLHFLCFFVFQQPPSLVQFFTHARRHTQTHTHTNTVLYWSLERNFSGVPLTKYLVRQVNKKCFHSFTHL